MRASAVHSRAKRLAGPWASVAGGVVLVLAVLTLLTTSLPSSAGASAGSSCSGARLPGIAVASTTPYRIVFAGSSTTAGYSASTAGSRYVDLLVSALHATYGTGPGPLVRNSYSARFGARSSVAGVHGYNAGQPATNARTYLSSAERTRLVALGPDLVVHMIGSNDFMQQRPVAAYRADVARVLADLRARTPSTRHLLVHSYQRLDVTRPGIPWSAYRAALEQVAAGDPTHVSVVDLGPAYAAVEVPGPDPQDLIGTDLVHQTDAGHAFMARRLTDPVTCAS